MRLVIQRVSQAKVEVNQEVVGEIQQGLLILLGIEAEDDKSDLEWLVKKLLSLRIFNDEDGNMNLSLLDIKGEALVVSQFTLHASTKKGNRPSFIKAARPEYADWMYEEFKSALSETLGSQLQSGVFGANMQVSLINDGPVTIIIDSKNRE